jgi:4-hydroxybenzoate polyprenyltransferase
VSRAAPWFALVRFGHSVFALPFALIGAWVASGGVPAARVLALVVLCAVAARTAAMAFNRLADARFDAANPRTRGRELPRGAVSRSAVAVLVVVSAAVFVGGAFALNALCGWLSLPVLAVLLGYSLVKRVSALSHVVLGLCLGLAPLGAWAAVPVIAMSGFAIPYAIWYWLVMRHRIDELLPFVILMPIVSIVVTTTLLGEPLPPALLLGGAIVLFGLGVIVLRRRRPPAIGDAPAPN